MKNNYYIYAILLFIIIQFSCGCGDITERMYNSDTDNSYYYTSEGNKIIVKFIDENRIAVWGCNYKTIEENPLYGNTSVSGKRSNKINTIEKNNSENIERFIEVKPNPKLLEQANSAFIVYKTEKNISKVKEQIKMVSIYDHIRITLSTGDVTYDKFHMAKITLDNNDTINAVFEKGGFQEPNNECKAIESNKIKFYRQVGFHERSIPKEILRAMVTPVTLSIDGISTGILVITCPVWYPFALANIWDFHS